MHNLETLIWDAHFGKISDPKLARVLEQVCKNLQHVRGTEQWSFEFEDEGRICPASFLDIFESLADTPCYLVTFTKEDNANRDRNKRKAVEELD